MQLWEIIQKFTKSRTHYTGDTRAILLGTIQDTPWALTYFVHFSEKPDEIEKKFGPAGDDVSAFVFLPRVKKYMTSWLQRIYSFQEFESSEVRKRFVDYEQNTRICK